MQYIVLSDNYNTPNISSPQAGSAHGTSSHGCSGNRTEGTKVHRAGTLTDDGTKVKLNNYVEQVVHQQTEYACRCVAVPVSANPCYSLALATDVIYLWEGRT